MPTYNTHASNAAAAREAKASKSIPKPKLVDKRKLREPMLPGGHPEGSPEAVRDKRDLELDRAIGKALQPTAASPVIPPDAVFELKHDPRIPECDRKMLSQCCVEYIQARANIKELEAKINGTDQDTGLKERICATLDLFGVRKTKFEGNSISVQDREKKTINREKLLAHGVDPAIIDDCTDVSRFVVLDVRAMAKPKDKTLTSIFGC